MKQGKSYILIGDINANLISTDKKTERYLDVLYEAGFICGIDKPTRVDGNSRTCIDHIFVNHENIENIRTAIIETEITDHYSIFLSIKLDVYTTVSQSNEIFFLDNVKFSKQVAEYDWDKVLQNEDLNECANVFLEGLNECMNNSKKVIKAKPRLRPLKPWISVALVRSIRKRDKLSKLAKKQPFNSDLKTYFNRYKNILNDAIKATKINFYKNQIKNTKSNPKLFWKTINGKCNGKLRR